MNQEKLKILKAKLEKDKEKAVEKGREFEAKEQFIAAGHLITVSSSLTSLLELIEVLEDDKKEPK